MENMFQVDYIKNLSIVAVTGEVGFEGETIILRCVFEE
jgi:hypothetical protein